MAASNNNAPATVRLLDYDVSTLKFGSLRPGVSGGKTAWVRAPPLLSLPAMRAPFGLDTGFEEHAVALALEDPAVRERLEAIDALAMAFAQEHREVLFDARNQSDVMLEVNYYPCVKPPSDPKYAPTFKLKLKRGNDGAYQAAVFDSAGERAELNNVLNRGAMVQVLVTPRGFWAASNRFGVMWKVHQLKATPGGLPPNAFLPDTDEDEDELDKTLRTGPVLLDGNTGPFGDVSLEPDATASQEALADAAPTSQE